ncbi:hypothetical protein JYK14_25900 [Siccirubricoccus sp. KC 17139]|uniref:Uncharacterized protein n=1 Tax=Siccirubricoccus soli TaxID=2899147 RepID=A0ABT1DCA5_9PROT|nr:hypothetical protein [Siccirubricoccus soli]MCO6419572.1 hypothetical protein [Siccirubricoccus soli]MCP2685707.1 hypothetical protein [Siccirubricoccus soli]
MDTLRCNDLPPERWHARRGFLALPLLLVACAADPVGDYLYGFGDPVRGAALYAPQNLGDTSRWQGQPARAALAVEQLEFLANEVATNPIYAPEIDPLVQVQLDAARTEMRGFLGIASGTAPQLVIAAMRRVHDALRGGRRAAAEAALSSPAFAAGPLVTLQRLAALPRLPRTAEAANAVYAEFRRLENRRR